MKPFRLILVLSVIVILLVGARLFYQTSGTRHLQAELVATQARDEELRREIGQWEQRKAMLESKSRPTPGTPAIARTAAANQPGRPSPQELLARQRRAARATLDANYHFLFAKRGLSPEQIERVEQSIQDHNERKDDITAAAASQKLELTDPGVDAMRKDEMAKFRSEVSPLIGDDGIDQYFRAEHLLPATDLVAQLAGDPFASPTPLTQEQGAQLAEIIGAASPNFQKGGTVHYDEVDWKAVQTQAQALLSPEQFNAFQRASTDLLVRSQLRQTTTALGDQVIGR